MATYEFAKAQEFSASNPDNIYYDKDAAFRNQDYRQVFHQEGTIGTFSVRLLEAADLSRNYWSALALGPMKHLGLSKAHGGVSSFISFSLDKTATSKYKRPNSTVDFDQKMHPRSSTADNQLLDYSAFVSPVVPNDNNPVWTNCQFEIPLKKGALQDGQPVRIALRVDEDATTLENMIPGIPSAGGVARLLGIGKLDVTSLCLGQNPATGRPTVGVIDTWVPISLPDEHEQELSGALDGVDEKLLLHNKKVAVDDFDKKIAATPTKSGSGESYSNGRVRVSITYTPHGMEPQKNDVVALEAFARQNSQTATCRSILPPLLPLHVVEKSDPWLLVKYWVPTEPNEFYPDEPQTSDDRKAYMRLHRNAVFVIERKNLLDGALNLALQPAELLLSTPLGQGAAEALGPVLMASKQLLMPALVSSKLLWMAVRTTALAGFTGVSAAGSAFVNEGTNSLTKDNRARRSVESRVRYV